MKNLLARRNGPPGIALGCIISLAMTGSLVAQTTGAVNPTSAVDPSTKDEPSAGGCMPIGITVSGEVVFPLQCRGFIERLKAADRKAAASSENQPATSVQPAASAEHQPAISVQPAASGENQPASAQPAVSVENKNDVSGKPVAGEEPVAKEEKTVASKEQPFGSEAEGAEDSKPAEKPVAKAPLENRNEHKPRERGAGPLGCARFRSYDAASETYKSYDGRRLPCKGVDRAAMAK